MHKICDSYFTIYFLTIKFIFLILKWGLFKSYFLRSMYLFGHSEGESAGKLPEHFSIMIWSGLSSGPC